MGCADAGMPKPEMPLVIDAHTFPQARQMARPDASGDALLPSAIKSPRYDATGDSNTEVEAIDDVTSARARDYQKLAQSPELPGRLASAITLELLWQLAYARNAQLAGAREQVTATRRRYEQAAFLYNLSGQYGAFTREMSGLNSTAGAMMPEPPIFPGALALSGQVISSEVKLAQLQHAMAWRDLKSDIARVYHELYVVTQTIHIEEEQVALLETLEKIARDQFKSGMVGYGDVLKAQMTKASLAADIGSYRNQETSLRQKLLAAINLPPETVLAAPGKLDWQLKKTVAELRTAARGQRQELRMASLQIVRTTQMIALAKAQDNLYPAFATGMSFLGTPMAANGDTTSGMTTATTDSPKSAAFADSPQIAPPASFAQRASYLAEMQSGQAALVRQHENLLRQTDAAIAEQHAMLESSERFVRLYEDSLIPLARETLQVTQLAYQSNKANFLEVLDAQRMLLQFRLEWQKNRRDYLIAVAELERIVGKSLIPQEGK